MVTTYGDWFVIMFVWCVVQQPTTWLYESSLVGCMAGYDGVAPKQ